MLPFEGLAKQAFEMQDFQLDTAIDHLYEHIKQAIALNEIAHAAESVAMLRILIKEQRSREV
jgi:hypothetical protein